jgi:hypothetical protein
MFAAQMSDGRSSITHCSRSSHTAAERIHAGACDGQRFSKNDWLATPSGHRTIVTGRSARCGTITRPTRA